MNDQKLVEQQHRVLTYMRSKDAPVSTRDLMNVFGTSRVNIRRRMDRLIHRGLVRKLSPEKAGYPNKYEVVSPNPEKVRA